MDGCYFRSSIRIPVAGPVGVGGGYSWYSRKTTYSRFFEARQTQSEWRIFLDLALAGRLGAALAEYYINIDIVGQAEITPGHVAASSE